LRAGSFLILALSPAADFFSEGFSAGETG